MLQSKFYKLLLAAMFAACHIAGARGAVVPASPVPGNPLFHVTAFHPASSPAPPSAPSPTPTVIPTLNWQPRSDWVNVKTSVLPSAVGDGVHDDTSAIQAALNQVQDGMTSKTKTVYLPPGTYKITKTLVLTKVTGAMIVGCGQGTHIVWAGPLNQAMYLSNGATFTRYVGLTWDGRGIAGVGVDHQSHTYFEFRNRHQDEAFLNFRTAGIRVGFNQICSTSEVIYQNCLFQNCQNGAEFLAYNDYDNDFDGCAFQNCGTAINCYEGNVYARDCNFVGSLVTDLWLCPQSHSVRRCTSEGSNQFILVPTIDSGTEVTVEDCHVDSWRGSKGAISFGSRGPDTVFDCVFTHSPDKLPPIRMNNPGDAVAKVTICNNSAPDAPSLVSFYPGIAQIVQVPTGTRGGNLTGISRSFVKSVENVSGNVLDVKTMFGAKGDGSADDTAAIQAAIAAAKAQGGGATVYFPPGEYKVYSTLSLTGGGYKLEGAGYCTTIHWCGNANGSVFSVQDPQDITLAQMRIFSVYGTVALVQQTSADNTIKSLMTYDGVYVGGSDLDPRNVGGEHGHIYDSQVYRGIELDNLPSQATVHFNHLDGTAQFHDCSRATILINDSMQGVIQIDGADYAKSGFAGCLMRYGANTSSDYVIRDNQDFVQTNYYCEQTQASLLASGDGAYVGQPGHVTIAGTRNATYGPPITINDYEGRVTLMGAQMTCPPPHIVVQTGTRPADLLLVNNMIWDEAPSGQMDTGGQFTVLQNILDGDGPQYWTAAVPSQLPGLTALNTAALLSNPAVSTAASGALADVAAAFDDFRQLGAVDLAINHP